MKWSVLTFILLIFSSKVFASINFTYGYGVSNFNYKELSDNDGAASGSTNHFKLGLLQGNFEVGIYLGNQKYSLELDHDSETNTLDIEVNTTGAYFTYYSPKFYFELGYGKAEIKESLESDLSSASKDILIDIYDLNLDGTKVQNEARGLVGLKVFEAGSFYFNVIFQRTIMLDSSHTSNLAALEIKANF